MSSDDQRRTIQPSRGKQIELPPLSKRSSASSHLEEMYEEQQMQKSALYEPENITYYESTTAAVTAGEQEQLRLSQRSPQDNAFQRQGQKNQSTAKISFLQQQHVQQEYQQPVRKV